MRGRKGTRCAGIILLVVAGLLLFLSTLGTVAHAAGLVDDRVNASNLYSKYPLFHYQLDFYVDDSWDWLPWNWGNGIGKSVMYGLYCITNFVWVINLYLSNATGYVVAQAYKLDFIGDMADAIGKNIQTIAGVTARGFSGTGFYVGFLLLLILVVGIYVAYTGLLKKETSKAFRAVINLVAVFLLSASFIAYAPEYVKKINEFSSDISTAALDLGTKIVAPDTSGAGQDSVDAIRNSLFAIQIRQPWLLLQYGNSNVEEIGIERVEKFLSTSPTENNGKDREDIVKQEIEDKENHQLSLSEVVNRLGTVLFISLFNIGITLFVFLLMGMMILSQILFIIFATFLPLSFLLSMIPSYEGMAKKAIVKVFNTIMTRAGITLIVTVAFSISAMLYNVSKDYPFFMVAFLQIVVFAGIYLKLGDIMSMFSLNGNDSQGMGRRIFRRPYMFVRQKVRSQRHRVKRGLGADTTQGTTERRAQESAGFSDGGNKRTVNKPQERQALSAKHNTVRVAGTSQNVADNVEGKAQTTKEHKKGIPIQRAYAAQKEKEKENILKKVAAEEKESFESLQHGSFPKRRRNITSQRTRMPYAKEQINRPLLEKGYDLSTIYNRPNWNANDSSAKRAENTSPLSSSHVTAKREVSLQHGLEFTKVPKHVAEARNQVVTSPVVASASMNKTVKNLKYGQIKNNHTQRANKNRPIYKKRSRK